SSFKFSCLLLQASKSASIGSASVLNEGKQDGERRLLLPDAPLFCRSCPKSHEAARGAWNRCDLCCAAGLRRRWRRRHAAAGSIAPTPTAAYTDAKQLPDHGIQPHRHVGPSARGRSLCARLGYTGAGVIVGVVDFNFQLGSSEINFHPDSVGPNSQAIALYEAQTATTVDSDPHGHAVAGVIAAKKNDTLVHGIAFDAQ